MPERDMGLIDRRLCELQIELPEPSRPGANYVPFIRSGSLLFLTGQLSQWNGERRFVGKLGREIGLEEGRQAARLCALNLIAHLRDALEGKLDRVRRCVRVAGFVRRGSASISPTNATRSPRSSRALATASASRPPSENPTRRCPPGAERATIAAAYSFASSVTDECSSRPS